MSDYCKAVEETGYAKLTAENEALRAENEKLRDLIYEASKIYVSLTNDSDDKIKQIVTSIKRLKDS